MTGLDPITTIASIPAILAIVTLVKDLGLPSRLAPLAAVLIAIALNVAAYLWSAEPIFGAVAQGAIFGLAAAGVFDIAKITGQTKAEPPA